MSPESPRDCRRPSQKASSVPLPSGDERGDAVSMVASFAGPEHFCLGELNTGRGHDCSDARIQQSELQLLSHPPTAYSVACTMGPHGIPNLGIGSTGSDERHDLAQDYHW